MSIHTGPLAIRLSSSIAYTPFPFSNHLNLPKVWLYNFNSIDTCEQDLNNVLYYYKGQAAFDDFDTKFSVSICGLSLF